METSGLIGGKPARNIYRSDLPKVKAKPGPLPEGKAGIEFVTDIAPEEESRTRPEIHWHQDSPGVLDQGFDTDGTAVVAIPARIVKRVDNVPS